MEKLLRHIRDHATGRLNGKRRSSNWHKVRGIHLLKQPACMVCSHKDSVEVHHIVPVHVAPEKEEDPGNFITLCEGPMACHRNFGHLGSFHSYNANVIEDAVFWSKRISGRP